MSKELANRAPSLPPAMVSKIAEGIAKSSTGGSANRGQSYMKMDTDGTWVIGITGDEISAGSTWVANIASLQHGYVCWHEGKKVDEHMSPMWEDAKAMPAVHPTGAEYKPQLAVEMKCVKGKEEGTQARYSPSSMGGNDAMYKLKEEVRIRIEEVGAEDPYIFPVLTLDSYSYPNKKAGGKLTFNPVLEIVGWADAGGNLEGGAEEADEPEPEPEPVKPARASRPAQAEAPTNGQRRRPAAR